MDSHRQPNHPHLPPGLRALRRFVAWFLARLYTDWAWAYDWVASITSMGQWWIWQRAIEGALPPGRLLEVGHGTGRLLQRQLEQGRSVFAVDLSAQMGRITKDRLEAAGLPTPLVRAKAESLPFRSGAFQGAYATFPSEFILQSAAIAEVLRVLSTGEFLIVPMAWITGGQPWDRLARWLYTITGQAPDAPDRFAWLQALEIPGGDLDWEVVDQPRARVLRLRIRAQFDPESATED